MNKRIKELYKQSWFDALYVFSDTDSEEFRMLLAEKFAELIVKACADAADDARHADCAYPGDYIVESMELGIECGAATWRSR